MRGLVLGLVFFGLAGGVAHADDSGWIVTIGGRVAVSPPYEGAGHDVLAPSPTFSVRKADSPYRFSPPDDSSSIALLSSKYISFGPAVKFRYARGNEGQLTGLNKIDWAAEPGAFLNLWPANWLRCHVEARRGVIGHYGWVGDAGVDLIYPGKRFEFSIGPRIGYGDRHYMDTYFGVTTVEAARSPLITTAYEPGAGERYRGVEAAVSYRLVGGLRTTFDVGYHKLSDLVADSPVIQVAGKRDQFSGGVTVSYSFGVGQK